MVSTEFRVLMLMPFDEQFDPVARAIENAARACGAEPLRLDELALGRIGDTVKQVQASDIVVADLTALNSNVLVEVGTAAALGANLIAIQQEPLQLPSLLTTLRVITYRPDDLSLLEQKLSAAIEALQASELPRPIERRLASDARLGTVLAAARVGTSPFGFVELLGTARKTVFGVAQNQYYLLPQRGAGSWRDQVVSRSRAAERGSAIGLRSERTSRSGDVARLAGRPVPARSP